MSPEQRRKIVSAMVEKGVPTAKIASRIGVPISTVRTDRLILSAPYPDEISESAPEVLKPITEAELNQRREDVGRKFHEGLNDREIAQTLGITKATVIRDRSRLGLSRKPAGEPIGNIIKVRRAKVKALIEKGAGRREIMLELNLSHMMVSRDRIALGYGLWDEGQEQEVADRRIKVKDMVGSGKSYKKVASELGVSSMTVKRDCEAMGMSSPKAFASRIQNQEARRAEVRRAHGRKMNASKIARMLSVSPMTVRRDMEALGLD